MGARNSSKTKELILSKAQKIFAWKGMDGARVAEIALEADINKGMIYHYFTNKDNLYKEVLKRNFEKLQHLAQDILLVNLGPCEKVEAAIKQYFYFLAEHPEFVRLMNWESLQDNKYASQIINPFFSGGIYPLESLVKEGKEKGVFRKDLNIRQFLFSVNALCFFYFSRKSFLEDLWKKDITNPNMLEERLKHIINLVFEGILDPTYKSEKYKAV